MIKEAYCSFEVSKLLKKKGFDGDGGDCECHMFYCEYTEERIMPICEIGLVPDNEEVFFAPTHQMAMKWLREVYHIEINITSGFPFINGKQQYKYFWSIVRVCDNHLEYPMDDPNSAFYNEEMADSFEEAVESALKYCLENLI